LIAQLKFTTEINHRSNLRGFSRLASDWEGPSAPVAGTRRPQRRSALAQLQEATMAPNDKAPGGQPEPLASLGEAARSGGVKPEQQGVGARPETAAKPDDPKRKDEDAAALLRSGGTADVKRETRTGSARNSPGGGAASATGGKTPSHQAGSQAEGETPEVSTLGGLRETAREAASRIQDQLPSADQAREAVTSTLRQASSVATDAARRFADDVSAGKDPVREYGRTVIDQVQRQPVTSVMFAFLAGYVFARIWHND
jgi:hypothetical protein